MNEAQRPIPYIAHPRDRIHQGDIICNLEIVVEGVNDAPTIEPAAEIRRRDFAVVLTQECDLEQDHRVRTNSAGESTADKGLLEIVLAGGFRPSWLFKRFLEVDSLPSVLLASARNAVAARATQLAPGKPQFNRDAWSRVALNKDERYQCLESCPAMHDGLLIDFKQVFSVSTDYLYTVLERSPSSFLGSMTVPYREQLSSRFAYFMSRVALPRDHEDPAGSGSKKLSSQSGQ